MAFSAYIVVIFFSIILFPHHNKIIIFDVFMKKFIGYVCELYIILIFNGIFLRLKINKQKQH